MISDENVDNDKPAFRRTVKWRILGRATFNCERTRIRMRGDAFPDAGSIIDRCVRCTRRQSEVDDGAEGWRTVVRFFNDSA
jgi:hypothetical protein